MVSRGFAQVDFWVKFRLADIATARAVYYVRIPSHVFYQPAGLVILEITSSQESAGRPVAGVQLEACHVEQSGPRP